MPLASLFWYAWIIVTTSALEKKAKRVLEYAAISSFKGCQFGSEQSWPCDLHAASPSAPLDFALDYDVQLVVVHILAMIYSHCVIFLESQQFVIQITNCLTWLIEVQADEYQSRKLTVFCPLSRYYLPHPDQWCFLQFSFIFGTLSFGIWSWHIQRDFKVVTNF